MRGLYVICDTGTLEPLGFDPVAFARAVLPTRPCAFQLRAKGMSCASMVALLRELRPLAKNHGVPLFANDRPDAAVFAGCDGVHLGQTDMAVDVARKLAPGLLLGISTHTPVQLAAALALTPTYVAIGPVFSTQTKVDAEPVIGLVALAAAKLEAAEAGVPLVAIGGITLALAKELRGIADAVAVISDLTRNVRGLDDVAARARLYRDALAENGSTIGGDSSDAGDVVRGMP